MDPNGSSIDSSRRTTRPEEVEGGGAVRISALMRTRLMGPRVQVGLQANSCGWGATHRSTCSLDAIMTSIY